jgi:hypothetical protein
MRHLFAATFLVQLAVAQTFVVDAANGPGAHFTSLPAAVAAVPDGSVLLVRPGSYSGFTLVGKGLTILADPGVAIVDGIVVSGLQVHQPLTLRGLQWPVAFTSAGFDLLLLDQCAGPVLLEDLVQPAAFQCLPGSWPGLCFRAVGVHASNCAQVVLRDCTIACTAGFSSSNVVLEATTVSGENVAYVNGAIQAARSAVSLSGGSLQLAGPTAIRGGYGQGASLISSADGHGVVMSAGDLRVLDGVVASGAGMFAPVAFAVLALGSNAQVRVSPRATILASATPPILGTTATVAPMPSATGTSAAPGGVLAVTVATEPLDLVVVLIGLPGPPAAVPGFVDGFWLDAGAHLYHAIGVQQPSAPVTGAVPVPNVAGLVGLRINWQAACFGAPTGTQATNPVGVVVR